MCVRLSLCLYVCVCVFHHVYGCMCVFIGTYVFVFVCVRVRLPSSKYRGFFTRLCFFGWTCMLWVFVCVCVESEVRVVCAPVLRLA